MLVLPETDLHRIRLWARERVPEHLWDELEVEADVADRRVTIVEVRPPWDGVGEHTRFPIARLRYTRTTGLWSIYWRDRTSSSARVQMEGAEPGRAVPARPHRGLGRPDLLGLSPVRHSPTMRQLSLLLFFVFFGRSGATCPFVTY